jgi:hypothetical protein
MESMTRFGNLGRAFDEGRSELPDGIARICILYEDLRIEIEELRIIPKECNEPLVASVRIPSIVVTLAAMVALRDGLRC